MSSCGDKSRVAWEKGVRPGCAPRASSSGGQLLFQVRTKGRLTFSLSCVVGTVQGTFDYFKTFLRLFFSFTFFWDGGFKIAFTVLELLL